MSFLFGSPSKSNSTSTENSSSSSSNQAFGTLNNALSPVLGNAAAGSNMMASILGIPQSSSSPSTPSYPPAGGGANPSYNLGGGGYNPSYNPTSTPAGNVVNYRPGVGYQQSADNQSDQANPSFHPRQDLIGGQAPFNGNVNNITGQPSIVNAGNVTQTPTAATSPGTTALDNFGSSAGMDFLRNQGTKAIEASQAGKGMLDSGATGKALETFGNNLGTTYLNDYLNHVLDYSKLGTTAAGMLGSVGNVSNSTGSGSGSSSGTGAKQGLISMMMQAAANAAAMGG